VRFQQVHQIQSAITPSLGTHVLAERDSGASMTMTLLISEAQQCNMSIKMADGSVLNSNIKRGFLDAICNGKLLPNIKTLHMPDFFCEDTSTSFVQRNIVIAVIAAP